ncbi:hypothetical protein K388_05543 [Streptomyces sp. KhCrAH-43]|nr:MULTISPECIES: hypothetical protein [unclassified Streptomyces]RAJ53756.1 hypothetical protein K388_05543 [Streptomyces sp. KhCrAH-43]
MADDVTRPRPNPIIDEPATPAECRRDYDAGADVRAAVDRQQARTRS